MKITNEIKLFIVQFGKPDRGDGWISMGSSEPVFYVLALDYGSPCQKAINAYDEWKDSRPMLDSDGSLNIPQRGQEETEIGIKNVKLACDKIIY